MAARSLESIKPNEKPFPSLGETFAKPRANLHVEEEDLNLQIEICGFFFQGIVYIWNRLKLHPERDFVAEKNLEASETRS